MTNIRKSLCWAAAILLNALGNACGLIDDKTAETLFVILPIVAVLSLNSNRPCSLLPRNKGA